MTQQMITEIKKILALNEREVKGLEAHTLGESIMKNLCLSLCDTCNILAKALETENKAYNTPNYN